MRLGDDLGAVVHWLEKRGCSLEVGDSYETENNTYYVEKIEDSLVTLGRTPKEVEDVDVSKTNR